MLIYEILIVARSLVAAYRNGFQLYVVFKRARPSTTPYLRSTHKYYVLEIYIMYLDKR